MKLTKTILRFTVLALLLFLQISIFRNPHKDIYTSTDSFPFSKGSASDQVRLEVLEILRDFQAGYQQRDLAKVEPFMNRLFSRDTVLILGTMPQELFVGYDEASDLVRDDWASWGDCTFLIEGANISAHGDVAWFSTIGYVRFDISSLLVAPLRLSGILVNEGGAWKLQQVQYQFDLDFTAILVTIILISAWLALELLSLVIAVCRRSWPVRDTQ